MVQIRYHLTQNFAQCRYKICIKQLSVQNMVMSCSREQLPNKESLQEVKIHVKITI